MLSTILTAVTAVQLFGLASAIYRRAIIVTGRRVRLREVLIHQGANRRADHGTDLSVQPARVSSTRRFPEMGPLGPSGTGR